MIQTNLRIARENKGISKVELAKKIGVSDPTIGNWENSEKNLYPPIDKLMQICDILGVTINDIVDDESDQNESIQNEEEATKKFLNELEELPEKEKDIILQLALQNNTLLDGYSVNERKKITQTALNLSELLYSARSGVRTLDTLIKSHAKRVVKIITSIIKPSTINITHTVTNRTKKKPCLCVALGTSGAE